MFACPAPPPMHRPALDRPRYALRLKVASDLRHVDGKLTVRFTPNRATDRIVFRLWPNGPKQLAEGQRLVVGAIQVNGRDISSRELDPTTLVVSYGIAAHGTVTIRMNWHLLVPANSRDRIARGRDFVRLGSFFPILAWDDRRGWVTDPPTRILAETSTSPTADFDVRVTAPKGLQTLVSGTRVASDEWHADAVRDIGVALGRFATAATVVRLDHPVHVIVGVAGGTKNLRAVLALATRALRHFSRTYGSYPWSTYTVVGDPDIPDEGIEYPTLVFVGPGNIERIVVDHETAHQWFYSLVGDDQARDPWLDEALATWSQERLDGLGREGYFGPAQHVGAPMTYWAGKGRAYYRDVYGGGPEALRSLESPAKVDCALRFYVARDAYQIAQPADLLDELDRFIPGASARLRRFGIHS